MVYLGALGAIADDGHRPERLSGLDRAYRHRLVHGSTDVQAAPHQQHDARAKLEVGAGLDVQVMAPRQDEVLRKAIGATTQPQLAGGGLADIQVRVRRQPRLDGRCGRQRGRAVPRRRVAGVMRRDTPRLDLLAGDGVDKHKIDVFRAQITGR